MKDIQIRHLETDLDFIKMRELLIHNAIKNEIPSNMQFYYLDNWRFSRMDEPFTELIDHAVLYFLEDKLIGFSILDNEPLYLLQMDTDYFMYAEKIISYLKEEKKIQEISIFKHHERLALALKNEGFKYQGDTDIEFIYDLKNYDEDILLDHPFIIKTFNQVLEKEQVYQSKGQVFSGPHMSMENVSMRMKLKTYAPSYKDDQVFLVYDQVNDICASFAMAWVNEKSGLVGYEPIGTIPSYRKKGLSKNLLKHTFNHFRKLGYKEASIRTGYRTDHPSNYLYQSLNPKNTYLISTYTL